MKANPLTTLAETIQHKLANQGFLDSTELSPFISQAIEDAMESQKNLNGVLIDGFPRCVEQSQTYHSWPFQEKLPLVSDNRSFVRRRHTDGIRSAVNQTSYCHSGLQRRKRRPDILHVLEIPMTVKRSSRGGLQSMRKRAPQWKKSTAIVAS